MSILRRLRRLLKKQTKPLPNGCPAAYAVRGAGYHLKHCVLEKGHPPPCQDEDGTWRKDLLQ